MRPTALIDTINHTEALITISLAPQAEPTCAYSNSWSPLVFLLCCGSHDAGSCNLGHELAQARSKIYKRTTIRKFLGNPAAIH
jgi:hypothetical protein